MTRTNDGYIMLLDAVYFNGVKLGNIAEDGVEWGGDAAEYIKLYAAQVRTFSEKDTQERSFQSLKIQPY